MAFSASASPAGTPGWPEFLAFLQHAAQAKSRDDAQASARFLDSAAAIFPLDDASIGQHMLDLLIARRCDDAIALAAALETLEPERAFASFRLGYALQTSDRHDESIAPFRRAMALDPSVPSLRARLAAALGICRIDPAEQVDLLRQALADDPLDIDALTNLTGACRFAMDLDGALDAGERAVSLAPDNPLALNNYALALKEAQRWDDAERVAQHALDVSPADPAMHMNRAVLHLVRGDYARGWSEHEARWQGSSELGGKRPAFAAPSWHGESLAGKTLLLWGEQGIGDVLQFCRFVPALADIVHRQGGKLVWTSFPQMGALLTRCFGGCIDGYSTASSIKTAPPCDYQIPLMSVPMVLGVRVDTLAAQPRYLQADSDAVAAWRTRLHDETRLKVGLTWTGSRDHQRNPFRRVGWERYADAFRGIGNVAFYSLQPGERAGLPIVDFTGEFHSLDDTAAFVESLDLVITVCTSVAHLSGALGCRTWVLLDTNPHWTWLLDRADSPWYPSATLYRQARFADWTRVLADVARDLRVLADAKHAG
ncbi:tetratricopeptide repeat-containing glycosyltransferase family protein [Paraburkholderia sp.]|uniref:tetratricopeptide repeat-containing glycosyltransferase family protein n=1 Tax=Paraburkholderia sp. TaxID=1926495 RepID=UPI00238A435A|nr:tetratricopeptide repeat-containing glycosyltransferase family protein [Paraburkholderia sp.]MDE1181428.1 tetratricopeptide repeat-containing glycosyltransferase family protein [Paraburkholderia sp.]